MMRHAVPNEAQFHVPITFTKLDMRDYLWNLYGVEAVKVRSRVQGTPITRNTNKSNGVYRPMFNKYMVVTLREPFRYPSKPRNEEAFAHTTWKMRKEMRDQQHEQQESFRDGKPPAWSEKDVTKQRKALREHAQRLLDGKEEWHNGLKLDPKWDDIMRKSVQARGHAEAAEEVEGSSLKQ